MPDTQIDVAKLFLFFIVVVVLSQMSTTRAENMKDASIYGVWRPIIYEFGGIEHPIEEGLMVITPNYLIATAIMTWTVMDNLMQTQTTDLSNLLSLESS